MKNPNIPPLPKQTDGDCPWCKGHVFDQWHDDGNLPEAAVGTGIMRIDCPHCSKPLVVNFIEHVTYETEIKARRSDADRKYMEAMGVPDDGAVMRVGMGSITTEADVLEAVRCLVWCARQAAR